MSFSFTPQTGPGAAPAGIRLPDATHVGGVRLQVSDLTRSLAYYQDVLGLRLAHARGAGPFGGTS